MLIGQNHEVIDLSSSSSCQMLQFQIFFIEHFLNANFKNGFLIRFLCFFFLQFIFQKDIDVKNENSKDLSLVYNI